MYVRSSKKSIPHLLAHGDVHDLALSDVPRPESLECGPTQVDLGLLGHLPHGQARALGGHDAFEGGLVLKNIFF